MQRPGHAGGLFRHVTGYAILVQRSLLEKALIILSAVPIAVFANMTRITVTAILHVLAGGPVADLVFHDLAGWLMMPLALRPTLPRVPPALRASSAGTGAGAEEAGPRGA